jgi:hypothetical protein
MGEERARDGGRERDREREREEPYCKGAAHVVKGLRPIVKGLLTGREPYVDDVSISRARVRAYRVRACAMLCMSISRACDMSVRAI